MFLFHFDRIELDRSLTLSFYDRLLVTTVVVMVMVLVILT